MGVRRRTGGGESTDSGWTAPARVPSGVPEFAAGGADEIPIKFLYAAIGIGFIALLILAHLATAHMTWVRALGMAGLGTLWIWVAGVIVSESLGRRQRCAAPLL